MRAAAARPAAVCKRSLREAKFLAVWHLYGSAVALAWAQETGMRPSDKLFASKEDSAALAAAQKVVAEAKKADASAKPAKRAPEQPAGDAGSGKGKRRQRSPPPPPRWDQQPQRHHGAGYGGGYGNGYGYGAPAPAPAHSFVADRYPPAAPAPSYSVGHPAAATLGGPRCFACGELGHFARDVNLCPNAKFGAGRQGLRPPQ